MPTLEDKAVITPPVVTNATNNMLIGQKIRKLLFEQMGKKPRNYLKIEIKTVVDERKYRVNIVCKVDSDNLLSSVHRPISHYVTVEDDVITFSPPVKPII